MSAMAAAESLIQVEVAYALPHEQHLITVDVPSGATAEQAVYASGILERCPEIDLTSTKVGIFSELASLDTVLSPGDRVEIYRPLLIDPKAQRRARAQAQKSRKA